MRDALVARGWKGGIGAILLASFWGCGYLGDSASFDPDELESSPGWILVPDVPILLQKEARDCGTTALTMVLAYWKVPMEEEDAALSRLLAPGQGTRAGELRDFAREKGLQSYLIHGEWDDLRRELARGHPVIVGLVKPSSSGAVTHYEVVVAIHPDREIVVTHDPANGWRQNTMNGFRREWEPAGYLTLVVFRGPESDPHPAASASPGGSPGRRNP